jgi:hypothetical protein
MQLSDCKLLVNRSQRTRLAVATDGLLPEINEGASNSYISIGDADNFGLV